MKRQRISTCGEMKIMTQFSMPDPGIAVLSRNNTYTKGINHCFLNQQNITVEFSTKMKGNHVQSFDVHSRIVQ